jgi:C-terminal processing protease CtpA/Prc
MKKSIGKLQALVTILILLSSKHSFSQTETQKIAIYDKVWGFIKYHHPAIATGNMDWDSVYLAHLHQVIAAKSTAELNRQISSLIDAAGLIKKITPVKIPNDVFKANFDLSWLNNSKLLTKLNREKLQLIYNNRNQGDNRFIKYNNQSDFSGEKQYEEISNPTAEYRQLFLARFWNVINYFDPYKYLVGENWGAVLDKFIPKFTVVNNTLSHYKVLLELSVSLHNGHSYVSIAGDDTPINNLLYGKYTAPFYPQIIDGTALVRKTANDSLCNKADIAKGDIILEIDGIPVSKKIRQLQAYVSGSNKVAQHNGIARRLFDTHHASETLKIKRGSRIILTTVQCIPTKSKNWGDINNYTANETGYKSLGSSIAYIYAAQIENNNLDTIRKLIMRSKAVIFDVRNYPGQDAFFNIMGIMLPEPKYIDYSTVFMADNPGMFKWKPSFKIGDVNLKYFKGKTIILVDERSQSQGEYSAMVLQTIPGSVTIGSQTAGADGAVSPVQMGGKISIGFSGYGVYYPDKTPTQRIGVKIDIPVNKTIESVVHNKDLVVEKALNYLASLGIN